MAQGSSARPLLAALKQVLDGRASALLPVPAGADRQSILSALRVGETIDDDIALVATTSGTTGAPKGALLTAAALTASASATHDRLGGPGSWLLALPPHHIAGIQVLVRSVLAGSAPVELDVSAGFDTAEFPGAVSKLGAGRRYTSLVAAQLAKALTDPARDIAASSVVTAMSRNGTDFGIRVSGTGDRWFTAPVEMPVGLYFPGFSEKDANPDMGDSAIVETVGLGAFAMAAAPAVVGYIGAGRPSQAASFTRAMADIVVGANPAWTIPAMDFAGVPTGIDIRLVVETGIAPTINTGIAHREPGVGQVGAGVVKAPLKCFEQALVAFAETMDVA